MRFYSLSVIVALFAIGTTYGQDAGAKAVITKAIEAHGGAEALNKAKAGVTQVKGVMTLVGQDFEFTGEITYEMPDKYRMAMSTEVAGQKFNLVQIVNGTKQKSTNNGMAMKIGEPERTELTQAVKMQEVSMLTPLLTPKYTITLDKPETVGDVKTAVVVVTGKDFKETRLLFDSKTNLLLKTVRQGLSPDGNKEVLEESLMTDYKKIDGIQVPMKMLVSHDGKKFMTMTVTSTKIMEKADPKLFDIAD